MSPCATNLQDCIVEEPKGGLKVCAKIVPNKYRGRLEKTVTAILNTNADAAGMMHSHTY